MRGNLGSENWARQFRCDNFGAEGDIRRRSVSARRRSPGSAAARSAFARFALCHAARMSRFVQEIEDEQFEVRALPIGKSAQIEGVKRAAALLSERRRAVCAKGRTQHRLCRPVRVAERNNAAPGYAAERAAEHAKNRQRKLGAKTSRPPRIRQERATLRPARRRCARFRRPR